MSEQLRILWMSNSPWVSTGYGVQTRQVTSRLKQMGVEVSIFAFYGLQSGALNLNGMQILPVGNHPWGNDIVEAHMAATKSHVLITLMDVWVQEFFGHKAKEFGWAYCPWLPIDQAPVPKAIVDRLDGALWVLPYARWGEQMLNKAGVANTWYIPHGVDVNVYRPGDQRAARKALNLPDDRFIIGSVATNKGFPSRKCLAEQVVAFKRFKDRYKATDALLYLHCLKTTAHGGIDLIALLEDLGLAEGEDVIFSNAYTYTLGWSEERMVQLYQSFDFLTECSMGEGFGLPILEAQACGIPVVTTANTTSPELTWGGMMVDKVHPWWTPLNSWAYIPDVESIVEVYGEMYGILHDPVGRGWMAHRATLGAQPYHWDEVMANYWRPWLERVSADVGIGVERPDGS